MTLASSVTVLACIKQEKSALMTNAPSYVSKAFIATIKKFHSTGACPIKLFTAVI
jgi:hypothetical protein